MATITYHLPTIDYKLKPLKQLMFSNRKEIQKRFESSPLPKWRLNINVIQGWWYCSHQEQSQFFDHTMYIFIHFSFGRKVPTIKRLKVNEIEKLRFILSSWGNSWLKSCEWFWNYFHLKVTLLHPSSF